MVQNLINYGKSLFDPLLKPPDGLLKRFKIKTVLELWREMGTVGLLKLMWGMRKNMQEMQHYDLSLLVKTRLIDEKLIQGLLKKTAIMKTIITIVGLDRAIQIQRKVFTWQESGILETMLMDPEFKISDLMTSQGLIDYFARGRKNTP
ncbi:hypothetical protein ACFL27_01475 [candidate division CSSED10-310 bacterium]|uniref:Uncharacterized protein n=1 Tax=candidate division CSSED10-310 bacterium TaxID=2855610 RepID=A0ABV6YRM1_UNCC1